MKILDRLKEGLSKTSKQFGAVFAAFTGADDDFFDELEETLILADIGAQNAVSITDELRETVRREKIREADDVKACLAEILAHRFDSCGTELVLTTKPSVVLIIGVNGVGKTTTIGKLAMRYIEEGKKVLLCAGDTFRAAAGEQLGIWAERSGADIIKRDEGSDPASVIFDGINAAKARGTDILICDTAGRLHTKSNLMNELAKINRVIDRELPGADRETLLVLDATTGQNGLLQARQFKESADITGIVLTKLDGTAKGGIVYAIAAGLNIPVKLVGVGEAIGDLIDFDARVFSEEILR